MVIIRWHIFSSFPVGSQFNLGTGTLTGPSKLLLWLHGQGLLFTPVSSLLQLFFQKCPVLSSMHYQIISNQLSCPCWRKPPKQHDVATAMFYAEYCTFRVLDFHHIFCFACWQNKIKNILFLMSSDWDAYFWTFSVLPMYLVGNSKPDLLLYFNFFFLFLNTLAQSPDLLIVWFIQIIYSSDVILPTNLWISAALLQIPSSCCLLL